MSRTRSIKGPSWNEQRARPSLKGGKPRPTLSLGDGTCVAFAVWRQVRLMEGEGANGDGGGGCYCAM